MSPGSAYTISSPHIPQAELRRILVIAILKEEVRVDYDVKNRLEHDDTGNPLIGELDAILDQAGCSDSDLIFTKFFIMCVAEAWATSPQGLRMQDWRLDYKDNVLWAELRRP